MQVQQAEARQDESTSGSLTQQATTSTGQPTATTMQPAGGTSFNDSYIPHLVYNIDDRVSACHYPANALCRQ